MIAYRAESPLADEARETLVRSDDARALWQGLYVTPANLRPDYAAGTLTVELRRCSSALQDAPIATSAPPSRRRKPAARPPTSASSTARWAHPDSSWGSGQRRMAPGTRAEQKGFRVLLGERVCPWKEIFAAVASVSGVEFYLMEQEGSRYSEYETAEHRLATWIKMRG